MAAEDCERAEDVMKFLEEELKAFEKLYQELTGKSYMAIFSFVLFKFGNFATPQAKAKPNPKSKIQNP